MEAAAEHQLRAPEEQVRIRVLGDRVWVGDRDQDAGVFGTDASDVTVMRANEFRVNSCEFRMNSCEFLEFLECL